MRVKPLFFWDGILVFQSKGLLKNKRVVKNGRRKKPEWELLKQFPFWLLPSIKI